MSWYDRARTTIAQVHARLPETATLAERKVALQNAYPFGVRQYHPYKAWCRAQREYLARYSTPENDPKHAAWKAEMVAKGFSFGGPA